MVEWLEHNGAKLCGVEVAPMSPESTERGLFATIAHAPGAEIARVPRTLCVTAASSGRWTAAGTALSASGMRPIATHQNLYLALWLLEAWRPIADDEDGSGGGGGGSGGSGGGGDDDTSPPSRTLTAIMQPFLRTLPDRAALAHIPIFWTDAERDEHLEAPDRDRVDD